MNRETSNGPFEVGRHGELKTPGGKLVVVDFVTREGRLAAVQIAGDFFLYPEDVLERWNEALEGAPIGCGTNELASRLSAAIQPTDVLVGVSPEAVATAVERGLAAP